MDAKEFRIRNFVKANGINQFRVDEIYISEHQGYVLRMYFDLQNRSYLDLPLNIALPIEITEEILLKAGFEKKLNPEVPIPIIKGNPPKSSRKALYYTNKDKTESIIIEHYFEHMIIDIRVFGDENQGFYTHATKLKGLHHLQNIVYDLTGKELEITF